VGGVNTARRRIGRSWTRKRVSWSRARCKRISRPSDLGRFWRCYRAGFHVGHPEERHPGTRHPNLLRAARLAAAEGNSGSRGGRAWGLGARSGIDRCALDASAAESSGAGNTGRLRGASLPRPFRIPAGADSRLAALARDDRLEIRAALHDRLASPTEELAVPPPEVRRAADVARLLFRLTLPRRLRAGGRLRLAARGLVRGGHAII
jgi:hypothetical protein